MLPPIKETEEKQKGVLLKTEYPKNNKKKSRNI